MTEEPADCCTDFDAQKVLVNPLAILASIIIEYKLSIMSESIE